MIWDLIAEVRQDLRAEIAALKGCWECGTRAVELHRDGLCGGCHAQAVMEMKQDQRKEDMENGYE